VKRALIVAVVLFVGMAAACGEADTRTVTMQAGKDGVPWFCSRPATLVMKSDDGAVVATGDTQQTPDRDCEWTVVLEDVPLSGSNTVEAGVEGLNESIVVDRSLIESGTQLRMTLDDQGMLEVTGS
jgi:hypothetical protein